jgi:hypothetical protein
MNGTSDNLACRTFVSMREVKTPVSRINAFPRRTGIRKIADRQNLDLRASW